MKDEVTFPHTVLPTPQPEAEVAGMAVTRPRNPKSTRLPNMHQQMWRMHFRTCVTPLALQYERQRRADKFWGLP